MLNFALLRQPLNWLTVFVMAAFFVVLVAIVSPQPRADA